MTCRRLFACIVATAALVAAAGLPAQASPPLPTSMAAVGDSITRAYDVNWSHLLRDDPAESWATGSDPAVDSQYARLVAEDPALAGHAVNDAQTSAVMSGLDAQVKTAAGQGVGYLTILMGANDLCTSSAATMTPTAAFRSQFTQALTDFTAADPSATVFVSSIPDIYQLWSALHTNLLARLTWSVFGICQSMLANGNTEAQRQQVVTQEKADNSALAAVCAQFARCRWDSLATYNVTFTAGDISTVDYFHPSIAGQQLLAATTWAAGPFA